MSDRYKILGKLARGGIGAIYRAHDTVMARDVAIKRLLPIEETHLNEAADESLEREAAALARFQHPNVVTIYAFESDDEGPYVVMELVEGENLKETIERGALPIDDFDELVLQTLDPLIAAKDMNLLHRDIKPSNVMLTWRASGRFQVKVLDFGLAKFSHAPSLQTLDQTGSFLGSIDYLAPEQLELQPLDQRTDLYSLACVLYYCLTQKPPFGGKNSAETIQNHLKHKVAPLRELRSDVPKPIADWLMRMMSRYPRQRPMDARAALKEFEAALAGGTHPSSEPVVEVVEEVPIAEVPSSAPEKRVTKSATSANREKSKPDSASHATRPKLNVSTGPRKPARSPASKPTLRTSTSAQRSGPVRKAGNPPQESLKKPLIGLALVVLAAIIVFFLLFGPDGNDNAGGESESAGNRPSTMAKEKGAPAPSDQLPPKPLPDVRNLGRPAKAPPPPITEGLTAHYKAGVHCWGGDNFEAPVKPGSRLKAWGNLAAGAADQHLLTVDPAHQDKGPKLQNVGPKGRPELNGQHPVLFFRNIDRLITLPDAEVESALSDREWTLMLVMRTESNGGQIVRFLGKKLPSRLLKLEVVGNGNRYKTHMTRGSLRPSVESELKGGKGKFLIFTFTWSSKGYGEQRHHYLLPDNKRHSGKSGTAPDERFSLKPARYSLGATDGATALNFGHDAEINPNKEGTGGFKGMIAEMLLYRRALPDAERKQVEDHLYQRYFAK